MNRHLERAARRIGLHPETWAGLSPNGIGQQKPHHLREMVEAAWDSRAHPLYAWQVLTRGVCDGCALGVAGLHDWTIEGIHLCTTRLRMLELNLADPFDPALLSDITPLEGRSGAQLRRLGRLGHPMRRRRGERGFSALSWEDALVYIGAAIGRSSPDRIAFYLTSRGLTNETYYTAAKAVRALGSANIDSAARVCHAPSTLGLKQTIGVAAATCSLRDVVETDLVVLWGTNPANNQPVFLKYLDRAIKTGTRVVVINPYLEPGLDRYWVPSAFESFLFGTRVCHLHVPVRPGGDVAFANAVLLRLMERNALDGAFIADHTEGWDDLAAALGGQRLDALLARAGVQPEVLDAFVDLYANARGAVFVWSMGITQHRDAVDGVRAIVNVALARGSVGRDGAGLMPIRGHSGVQGGAEMGAYATALPGGVDVNLANAAALSEQWGFPVPPTPGLTAPEMLDAAGAGDLDVLWSSGGNFLEVLPDPSAVRSALETVPLRVHADVTLTTQMLVPGDDVILLPVATRYEQEGGGTSTTTERRVAYSPQIPRQVGQARSEWRLYGDLVAAVDPSLRAYFDWPDGASLRAEIARVVPAYAGVEQLRTTGDAIQWGGRHLCRDGHFPTPSGRARFTPLTVDDAEEVDPDRFVVTTRRGKQFNSMVWAETDPLTGAGRDAVFIGTHDAQRLGLRDGDEVVLENQTGTLRGRAQLVPLPPGTIQVHWPEGNVLIDAQIREPGTGIPDYSTTVRLRRVGP
jgi:molybdopterin-dependent oxidoreductase alpha subunit